MMMLSNARRNDDDDEENHPKPSLQQQQQQQGQDVVDEKDLWQHLWVPQEVFCHSSLSNIEGTGHDQSDGDKNKNNNNDDGGDDDDDDDDDVSSIGCASASSRPSGWKNTSNNNKNDVDHGYNKDVAIAEATYNGLEEEEEKEEQAETHWPLSHVMHEPPPPPKQQFPPTNSFDLLDSNGDKNHHGSYSDDTELKVQQDKEEVAAYADDFDPFFLRTPCEEFTDYYVNTSVQNNEELNLSWESWDDTNDDEEAELVNDQIVPSDGTGWTSERYETSVRFCILGLAHDKDKGTSHNDYDDECNDYNEGLDDPFGDDFDISVPEVKDPLRRLSSYVCLAGPSSKDVPKIITVSPQKTGQQYHHNHHRSLWKQGKKKKRSTTTMPLHARIEMLHHQTQKPFRSVSKVALWSVKKVHSAIFVRPDPLSLLTKGHTMLLGGMSSKKGLALNDSLTASSVPGVQNVTSLDSSETGSWDDEESEHVSATGIRHRQSEQPSSSSTVTGNVNTIDVIDDDDDVENNEDDELLDRRFLYARQLLPVAETFQLNIEDGTIHSQCSL